MHGSNRSKKILIIILFIISGCAVQRAPSGGPEDKKSPELIFSTIENGSTGLAIDQELVFYFTEALDEVSVKRAITVFPLNLSNYEVKYRHKRIILRPDKTWNEDQAYSLVIDNNLSDLRNNSLNGSINFGFSTGDSIPSGRIRGRVFGLRKRESATIVLGKALEPDSLLNNFQYFSQSNNDGYFEFQYLPADSFRIFGFIDRDRSRSYDPRRDDLVLPVNLDIRAQEDSLLRLHELKTVRGNFLDPLLLSAKMEYPGKLILKYSKFPEKIMGPGLFRIDSAEIDTVVFDNEFVNIYYYPMQKDSLSLHVPEIQDTLGCIARDTLVTVRYVEFTDTLYRTSWENDHLSISPDPYLDSLDVRVESEKDTVEKTFYSGGGGSYRQEGFEAGSYTIYFSLPGRGWLPQIADSSGYTLRAGIKEDEGAGSLSLQFEADPKTVMLLKSGKFSYIQKLDDQGQCRFPSVVPGRYDLFSFRDVDGDAEAGNGRLRPFVAPEILRPLLQDIEVRKNWETALTEDSFKQNQGQVLK